MIGKILAVSSASLIAVTALAQTGIRVRPAPVRAAEGVGSGAGATVSPVIGAFAKLGANTGDLNAALEADGKSIETPLLTVANKLEMLPNKNTEGAQALVKSVAAIGQIYVGNASDKAESEQVIKMLELAALAAEKNNDTAMKGIAGILDKAVAARKADTSITVNQAIAKGIILGTDAGSLGEAASGTPAAVMAAFTDIIKSACGVGA